MMDTANVAVTNNKRSLCFLLGLGLTLCMSVLRNDLAFRALYVDQLMKTQFSLLVDTRELQQASPGFLETENKLYVKSAGNASRHHDVTKNVVTKIAKKNATQYQAVAWLQHPEISILDMFSDSWLMNKQMFLEANKIESIGNVEGASFHLFQRRIGNVRMTLDWFDFAVEHMSKWWKVLGVPQYDYALDRVTYFLDNYRIERLEAAADDSYYDRSVLRPTIALIAFQQYKFEKEAWKGHKLTVSSLSATIASLIQVGMGRIVVVGYESSDENVVQEAFGLFRHYQKRTTGHGTELAFARVNDDMVNSTWVRVNLPKAALLGLRRAMVGNDKVWTQTWMGENPSQYKYVYLTEPDTMLNTRPSSLRSIEKALQDGFILAPHRLQPIPYQDDVPQYNDPDSNYPVPFVPSDFKTPVMMDHLTGDVCCDEQAGPEYKPGAWRKGDRSSEKNCGIFWWRCGFEASTNNFTRLEPYEFMRLKQGTGVVSLAGTEHGRRCIPKKQGQCERRMSVNHPDHSDNPFRTKQ